MKKAIILGFLNLIRNKKNMVQAYILIRKIQVNYFST